MSLLDSLILSLVGFGVVLVALGLLAVFIIIMAKVVGNLQGKKSAAAPAKPAPAPAPVAAPAPAPAVSTAGKAALPPSTSMGEVDLHGVSDRDAALIMAIVADKLEAPLNTLVFKSIKEV